jgi:hypothetical protein
MSAHLVQWFCTTHHDIVSPVSPSVSPVSPSSKILLQASITNILLLSAANLMLSAGAFMNFAAIMPSDYSNSFILIQAWHDKPMDYFTSYFWKATLKTGHQ